jgi:hypothetical protein
MKMTFVSETLRQAGLPEVISKVDPGKISGLFKTQIEYLFAVAKSMNLEGSTVREVHLPKDEDAQDKDTRHLYEVIANPYLAGVITVFVGDRTLSYHPKHTPITFAIEGEFIVFTRH